MTTLGNLESNSNSYFEALATAERRALHSFFDQHVVEDDDLGYFALDEGDYNILPAHLAARWPLHHSEKETARSRRQGSQQATRLERLQSHWSPPRRRQR